MVAVLSTVFHAASRELVTFFSPWHRHERLCSIMSCLPTERSSSTASGDITAAVVAEAGVPVEVVDDVLALAEATAADGPEPISDPLTLLRHYNGRGKHVGNAVAAYVKTLEWRANISLQRIMASHGEGESYTEDGRRTGDPRSWSWRRKPGLDITKRVAKHVSFARLPKAASAAGEPIFLWRFCANDFDDFAGHGLQDALIDSYVAHIEDAFQALRSQSIQARHLVRGRFIIDIKGSSLDAVRYLPSLKRATAIGQKYYPEVVNSVTVVRAPAFAAFLYRLIQLILPRKFQQKMCILGDSFEKGLKSHAGVDIADLPPFLGGRNSEAELT